MTQTVAGPQDIERPGLVEERGKPMRRLSREEYVDARIAELESPEDSDEQREFLRTTLRRALLAFGV
jgi:hypothetical protein